MSLPYLTRVRLRIRGFTIYRDENDITMISFADRIAGRYAAEDVRGYVSKGDLITPAYCRGN